MPSYTGWHDGRMALPVRPPVAPMLSKAQDDIPAGGGWRYEPKWDGFRAIVFKDGDDVRIASRDHRPLNRYFPEVEEALRAMQPRCAVAMVPRPVRQSRVHHRLSVPAAASARIARLRPVAHRAIAGSPVELDAHTEQPHGARSLEPVEHG